jgi:hypothetical protein
MFMPLQAMAMSLLLLLASIFLVFMESQLTEVSAKRCTGNGNDNETTSSPCGSQELSNTLPSSATGNDGKRGVNDGVGDSLAHQKSKTHNHESSRGGSDKDTPFKLPFP